MQNQELKKTEQDILNNLNKDELFGMIKKKCDNSSKGALGLVLVAIAMLLGNLLSGYGLNGLWGFILLISIYYCWRTRKTMRFDSPDEFLRWHDETGKKEKLYIWLMFIIAIGMFGVMFYEMIDHFATKDNPLGVKLFLLLIPVVGIAFLVYGLITGKALAGNNESTYVQRLRELVNHED